MEDLVKAERMSFWKNKRVLLTGHTGFKGGWLALWLQQMGADLCGYALEPPTTPSLFENAQIAAQMRSVIADIRDLEALKRAFAEWRPEIVIHLAAQALVRASYDDPIGTYATNVMGTAHVLEAVRCCNSVRSVVVITSDKCYENREWCWPYRETDSLGGYDPYSNSKAAAELVVSAYRNSFFHPQKYQQHQVALASVRAGNVIGGGDWATDRLIPDTIRAFLKGQPVEIRNPHAVRPWQHVLEPVRGYLQIAERLYIDGPAYGEAWNFGPEISDARSVEFIVDYIAKAWGHGTEWRLAGGEQPHEAQLLKLDCSKAAAKLGWRPVLHLADALQITVDWYRAYAQGAEMRKYTLEQIAAYSNNAGAGFGEAPRGAESTQ